MAKRFDIHTTDFGWGKLPPALRLLAWLATVGLIAAVIQLGASVLPTDFHILSPKGGQTVLMLVALGLTAFIMSRTRRPVAEYGLAVSDRWLSDVLIGLAGGVALIGAAMALALGTGAAELGTQYNTDELIESLSDIIGGALIAVVCVVIVGFFAGELRQRHGHAATAVLTAILAAVCFFVASLHDGYTVMDARVTVTAALVAMLIVALRLMTGDIVMGAGLAAGFLAIERLADKSHMFPGGGHGPGSAWLAWAGNPRASILLWAVIALAATAALWRAKAHPRIRDESQRKQGLSRSFKRFYPLGTMGGLATLDVWLAQLWRARFRVGLLYVPRLLATLALSALNTVLSLPERLILPLLLRNQRVKDPVFVLGVHRSGTTHLQNLLSLDPQLITPRALHVMNPAGFRFSGWLLYPLLVIGTPWKRPMDAVRFGLNTPNEEEYALANLCGISPDWSIRLPRMWHEYDRYTDPARFTDAEKRRWKSVYLGFLRRLVWGNNRRPMLKNPYNTGRAALLLELFPDARFVHIHRHPFDTYRSNLHMASEAHCLFEVQKGLTREQFAAWFLDSYPAVEQRYYAATDPLPDDRKVEVGFEELEHDALRVIRRIYDKLGLEYTNRFDAALRDYLEGLKGYKKNVHRSMPEDEQQRIRDAMGPMMQRWGYDESGTG